MSLECPAQDDIYLGLLALLPRGRAWQTHDGSIDRADSVLKSFWYAIAGVVEGVETDICGTFDEFFCATASDDIDLWQEEYGLPDDCDPWGDDVCAKVATLGGTSAAYYMALAEDLGYATEMRWLTGDDAEFPGVHSTLHVVIDTALSAALPSPLTLGIWVLGAPGVEGALGTPDTSRLECALDRIIPAHCQLTTSLI